MKILGIDTSSEQVSVAVGDEENISASFQLASDRRHVESLIPAIELLLRNVGISIHELSAIAVDLGPGLFTGMRVGITTALTLSDIAELPLIGLDSLQVLAHGIERVALQELDDAEIVVPILDARRNQVYWSMHRIDHASGGSLEEIREPRVGEIEELVEDLLDRSQRSVVLGTGAVKYTASLVEVPDLALLGERSGAHQFAFNPHLPHASTLVSLAAKKYAAGRIQGDPIAPIYLRAPDAEIQWLTR